MLLAVEDPAPSVDITQFLQFGLLGLIFVMIVAKKFLVPEWTLNQLSDAHILALGAKDERIASLEADKVELKENLAQLQALTRDQIIPALVRANQLSADYVNELAGQKRRADEQT